MGRKRMPGLRFRGEVWHIDKQIKGFGRLSESCKTGDLAEAEIYATNKIAEIRKQVVLGIRPRILFREAATRYLKDSTHKSLDRDAGCLLNWDPLIGDNYIDEICMDVLESCIEQRKQTGARSGTICRELAVVRRVLVLCARRWRHKHMKPPRPWLDTVPLIEMPDWNDKKQEYPISWDEQARFFKLQADYLAEMSLFAVNTGLREEEICALQWAWEQRIPELGTSVFVIPGAVRKNRKALVVVLNRTARSIIEAKRGLHETYVFTYRDVRIERMNNTSWRRAWRKAGLPISRDVQRGPHNLRHTFGRRLRAADVPHETRKVLMGHVNGDVTTHYSAAEFRELIKAVEKIVFDSRKSPAATIIRSTLGNVSG